MNSDFARPGAARAPLASGDVVRRVERLCRRCVRLAVTLLAAAVLGWLYRITGRAALDFAGSCLVLAFTLQATAPLASWALRRTASRRDDDRSAELELPVLFVWLLAALALMLPTIALLHDVIAALAAALS